MMNFFQITPTELHLNGPNVGFSSVPLDANAAVTGIATFVAIGTATFPYNNTNGTFGFQWYFDGSEILDTSVDSSSNASIETSSGISTLTLSGLTGSDNNKKIFSVATYIPGPDETIIDYPGEGIGRSTSSSANLTAPPRILISKQPTSTVIGAGNTVSFDVEASVVPGGGSVQYQWNLEGTNLTNGTSSRTVQDSGANNPFPLMEITSDVGDVINLNWNELTTYSDFLPNRTYTLRCNGDFVTSLLAFGAGGGGSDVRSVAGSSGGSAEGTFTFVKDQEYKLVVGSAGKPGVAGVPGGGRGGGTGGTDGRGGGGGYSGLFLGTITHANSIIIAGGGGGSTGDPGTGGDGGGEEGENGKQHFSHRSGIGGGQTSGGGAKGTSGAGSALQGGFGDRAGAGGGGYYGGGGGSPGATLGDGAGGGGSGYIGGVTDGTNTTGGGSASLGVGADGEFTITRVAAPKTIVTTISGADTPNLKIYTDDQDFGGSLKCVITATNVINSPLDSQTVSYDVVPARVILNFEAYDSNNNIKTLSQNLSLTGSFAVNQSTFGSEYGIIQFTSIEKDSTLTLEMRGAAGADNGSNTGGPGGIASFTIKIKRNVEYTIIGVSNNSAVFIYEKSSLVAVVGQGGAAGAGGNGGAGGGINVAGQDGSGNGNGTGGQIPNPTLTGTFGSIVNNYSNKPTLYTGDSIAVTPNGGETVICTKGRYYLDQGINPCSDISTGEVQFRAIDGTLITDSSSLYRGFKPGYTVTETAGQSATTTGGNGGAGAQGGGGSRNTNGGGGGGSGWSNRISEFSQTQLGGNITKLSSVIFNTSPDDSNYYIDTYGRILIMAWSPNTPSNALPLERQEPVSSTLRYMNKITGKVLPTDAQNCIDDARWRAILDKARDGTQDWRLTATGWNNPQYLVNASPFNLKMMIDANVWPLESDSRQPASLTSWLQDPTPSARFALAWDENEGADATGGDYSLLWYVQGPSTRNDYGFGYYNHSNKPFFDSTKYSIRSANWWILPPGVPDFTTASPIFSSDQGNRDAPDNGINLPGA